MHTIELHLLNSDNDTLTVLDHFDTKAEALTFMKETGLKRSYWVQWAESESWADSIDVIQLRVNGEIRRDWFPQDTWKK